MNTLRRFAISGLLAFGLAGLAVAADVGSAEEAVAMVKKAGAYLKSQGKEKAFAEFSSPTGQFSDRDLYVAVLDAKGVTLAHGGNTRMVGKEMMEMRDVDGIQFIKKFIEVANAKGSGWVDYKWPNPVSKVIGQKSTYVEKVGDVYIICGLYKGR